MIRLAINWASLVRVVPRDGEHYTPRQAFLCTAAMAKICQHFLNNLEEFMNSANPRYESCTEARNDLNAYIAQYRRNIRLGLNASQLLTLFRMAEDEHRAQKP